MKRYIAIDLLALKKHQLTLEEWTLLENIYFMSNNEFGWCYASKDTLRDIIQVSNGQIYKIIKKLLGNEFLVKNNETGYLKVTQKWISISSGIADTKENEKGCGVPLQNLDNTPPKNGIDPLQNLDTKIDITKGDIKEEKEKDKKENSNPNSKNDLLDELLEEDYHYSKEWKTIIYDFIQYRKRIKKPLKTTGPIKAYIQSLWDLQDLGYSIDFCIEQMKANEWQTIKPEYIHKPQKFQNQASKQDKTKAFIENYYQRKAQAQENKNSNILDVEVM
ncbi:hypothetical protein H0A43_07340 [Arcobacter lanthieri]|uniref:hypothetical protein n=1 Tax=Aliarcobacter lanthieri TaxID=1355374 RepID=UPI00192355C3|nr:hypothetical protein [Aliarcobacter lanthieri]MBL3520285.1 hypothetical protein [Aliarcobacter lanthieri]